MAARAAKILAAALAIYTLPVRPSDTPRKAPQRVRQELRSLSPEERNRVFAALNVMKATETAEGRARYGPAYASYDELVAQHLAAAAKYGCDEAHLGAGFATFHRVFTLRFETILLAIDPRIEALPYWDYNVEAKTDDPRGGELWEWFGSSEGDAADGNAVKDGLFAHWRVRANASDISNYTNPYGLLRSPWNVNPSTRITRFRYACGSQTTFDVGVWDTCLTAPHYLEWYTCIDPTVHTWAHSFIGGVWNTERNVSRLECFLTNAIGIPSLWGNSCLDCTENCQVDGGECSCKPSRELRCVVDRVLAMKAPTYGDFSDAWSSPNDPIFFFHHANLDRHLMTWQHKRRDQAPGYSFPSIAVPCRGHGYEDVVSETWPFGAELLGLDREHGFLTNKDIIAADGLSPGSPYTYDTLAEGGPTAVKRMSAAAAAVREAEGSSAPAPARRTGAALGGHESGREMFI